LKTTKRLDPLSPDEVGEDTATNLITPVELVVLSVKQKAARCRLRETGQAVTLRASRPWDVVPGEIAVVRPRKQWSYARNPYLSGEVERTRLDLQALGLAALKLEARNTWNPAEHYWGEEGEPIEDWVKPIIAWGPRPEFEMEQVLPGADAEDPFSDPIIESNDRKDGGDIEGASKILMNLCQSDLRCLDAHAHLGNIAFDHRPAMAIRHYDVGLRIGELSLSESFDGLLPWGWIDNRPFLRCMNGFGLCLWRLGRFEEAQKIFKRMLWLNPSDNQGVRFLIDGVRAGVQWEPSS
jgi:tetratricopeptide (TPR) repeat protein